MQIYTQISKLTTVLIPSFLFLNLFGFESLLGAVIPTTEFSSVFCRTTDFPVLMYHHIRDYSNLTEKAAQNLSVSPKEFQSHLDYIKNQQYNVITTRNIQDGTVPCGSIMITFDDGYKNTYQNAFPLMQKYGFPGIASIIISKMDESGYMTGGEIRGLQDNQWEIASHTWTHPLLTQTHITKISHEITASKIALESWFHQKINIFVYPGGYYGPETLKVVESAGYEYAFTTLFGQSQIRSSAFELRRINMLPGITPVELEKLLKKAKETTVQ